MFRSRSKRSNASQLSGHRSQSAAYRSTYHHPPPPPPPLSPPPQHRPIDYVQGDFDSDSSPDHYPQLSEDSSSAVPDSIWFCHDFILGAGAVIIQPATKLIVLIYQSSTRSWFLPKGRKDTGESLEQTALREAYEESGYRAKFLSLALPSLAPLSPKTQNEQASIPKPPDRPPRSRTRPQSRAATSSASASSASRPPLELNTEPIYMTTQCLARRRNQTLYQYVTYWYVAYIEEDAVRDEDTGMPDEKDYESYLVPYEEAMKRLRGVQRVIADRAYKWWRSTEHWVEEELVESVARLGSTSPTGEEGGYTYGNTTRAQGEDSQGNNRGRGPYEE